MTGLTILVPAAILLASAVAQQSAQQSAEQSAERPIIVSITGSAGVHFTGHCVLVHGRDSETVDLQGVVPQTHEFAADGLRCRIESQSDTGYLHAEARKGTGAVSRLSITGRGTIAISVQ